MKKEYKSIFDKIEPKEELVNTVLSFDAEKRIVPFSAKKLIAVAAVFAIAITTGAVGINHKENINSVIPSGYNDSAGEKISFPDFSIVAYANDSNTVKELSKDIATPLNYEIFRFDIQGKSEDEIEIAFKELKEKYNVQYMSGVKLNQLEIQRLDSSLICRAISDYFDINVKNAENVKKITVSNESDYGEMVILTSKFHSDGDSRIVDFGGYEKGKSVSVSGKEFSESKQSGNQFEIQWEMSDVLWQKIDENPDFDFSAISDTVTFTVQFNDDTISQSSIQIKFDKNGKMNVKLAD